MTFTANEVANYMAGALDFYVKGQPLSSTIQDKPLLAALDKNKKTFPGGRGNIDLSIKGNYNSYLQGYSHDDTVTYTNPANMKRIKFPWRELHGGIGLTHTELKIDGVSVVDDQKGNTSEHGGREETALVSILEDKMEDMDEGVSRDFNAYMWGDGTADPKGPVGIRGIIVDDPTTGTYGGVDRAQNTWWRNRSFVGTSGIDISSASYTTNNTIPLFMKKEIRQLRRFGGRSFLALAGSGFIGSLEATLLANGNYSLDGFSMDKNVDMGIADVSIAGFGKFNYDPTLDDLGLTDRLYIIETNRMTLYVMEGEEWKQHSPSRPPEKYVIYRGLTWTGQLLTRQLNVHGVYELKRV
jgi:hypothetical protein